MNDQTPAPSTKVNDSVPRSLLFIFVVLWVGLVIFVAVMLSEGSSTAQPASTLDVQSIQQSLNSFSLDGVTRSETATPAPEATAAQ